MTSVRAGAASEVQVLIQVDPTREALLKEMALRDSLTGLLNSRYLHARLQEELASAKRHEEPTSLALFDIDHFKKVNDQYGHPVGDQMLQLIGQTIRSTLRRGEIAARVGGEEFALLIPRTQAAGAAMSAERIRKAIGRVAGMGENGQPLAVTVSAGVACTHAAQTQNAAALYRLADRALYQAKEQGRNRVVIGASSGRFEWSIPTGPADGIAIAAGGLAEQGPGGST